MNSKYIFNKMYASDIEYGPVFRKQNFTLFGDASGIDTPELYWEDDYRYVLIKPSEINKNEDMLFKTACYLFHHPKKSNDKHIVYFIGDKNIGEKIGKEFSNQTLKFVSYEEIKNWFPKNIEDIFRLVIRFLLGLQKYYGQSFPELILNNIYLFCINRNLSDEQKIESLNYLKNVLFEEHLDRSHINNSSLFFIKHKAIDKYQENEIEISKKAFIATKFGQNNEERIRIIKEVISSCGYEPICMDEYETNNWIMPEIFYQIKICDFVVADFSIYCPGAYYEAGYALALGKEVIHLFDKREETETNKLHFDIEQKSSILYENYDKLRDRLKKRITATISGNS